MRQERDREDLMAEATALVERADWEPALQALLDQSFRVEVGSTLAARVVRGDYEIDPGWAINNTPANPTSTADHRHAPTC